MSAHDPTPAPEPPPTDSPEQQRADARLLIPATAGWLTAALLLGRPPLVGALATALALLAAATLALLIRRPTRTALSRRLATHAPTGWTTIGSLTVASGLALAATLHTAALHEGPVRDLAANNTSATVRLKITSDPSLRQSTTRRPPYVVVRATIEQIHSRPGPNPTGTTSTRVRTPVLVIGTAKWQHVRYGQHIDATGRLEPAEGGAEVAAMLSTRSPPRTVDDPPWWLRAAERVRAGLRDAVSDEPEDVRGLLPALVMGDVSGVSADLDADFRTTGLTHLSAVSGTNLTLLLAFVLPLARLIGVRARGLTVVGLLTVVVFVVLARPQPSVLRAAAMGLIALAAMTGGPGQRRAVRSLSVAVIALLLLDTSLARTPGFALSVLATAGIILLGPGWGNALSRWLPSWLADAIACPLAAQLACTPIVAWLSGEVSLVAVAANLLAGPTVGPATILGFIAAGVALVSSELAQVVGWAAGWPARWIILVAREGADLPGAANAWPATVAGIAVLTLLCLALVLGLHRILARPIAMILAVVMLAVVVLRPVGSLGWPPDDWLFVACDVGQGDGLVLRAGDRTAVVVDTGPDPAAMDRCLKDLNVQHIPVVVLSHFHADHVGGLAGVLSGRQVDEIEVTPYFSPRAEYDRVVALAAMHGVAVRTVTFHERRAAGQVSWTTLWPARVPSLPAPGTSSATPTDEGSPENNASIAMMAVVGGLRILLTGDLEPESQRAVLATGADLKADVLKVPHHGSAQQDPNFIAAANARLAIISAGRNNDYGHPAPRTLDLLSHTTTQTATTNLSGPLTITNTNNHLALTTRPPPNNDLTR
ncbi:ComEC/Rec2 family competence protein [Kribbella sp. NPDC050459]|uniref:ComEC/Rec2 family competence protein n=1 Tax=Kribbella sp. NPDC050459 TaxID=3155785 RepID=UPI0033F23042